MQMNVLSGYKIMWMIVLFDLPVTESEDRKAAAKFRNELLNMGFSMSQYSVYYKLMPGKEQATRYRGLVANVVPSNGKVEIVMITDKQYGNIVTYYAGSKNDTKKADQLILF